MIDGAFPLRNPSAMTRHTKREGALVLLHTGEFFLSATDLKIPGRHLDWSFRRTYRSQVDYDGMLGHNWDTNLNARPLPLGTDVLFFDGTGRGEQFFRVDMSHFTSSRGRYAVLTEHDDFSFTLREPHGVLWNFHALDGSILQGALEGVEDRFGDRMTLAYDHQGLLTTITDGLGRAIAFSYDAEGRLTSFTDFAGPGSLPGGQPAGAAPRHRHAERRRPGRRSRWGEHGRGPAAMDPLLLGATE